MITRIHVNQHIIRKNRKYGMDNPPITVRTSKSTTRAHTVEIQGPSTIVYRPDRPLSCGARLWIETSAPVVVGGTDAAADE